MDAGKSGTSAGSARTVCPTQRQEREEPGSCLISSPISSGEKEGPREARGATPMRSAPTSSHSRTWEVAMLFLRSLNGKSQQEAPGVSRT